MQARKLFIVEIIESSFIGLNGEMCNVYFENGVSKYPVQERDALRIAGVIRVKLSDYVGTTEEQESGSGELKDGANDGINGSDGETGKLNEIIDAGDETKIVETKKIFKYTREELEALADSQGISGLREAASAYGIKGKTINDIIEQMLAVKVE